MAIGNALLTLLTNSRVIGEEACAAHPALTNDLGKKTVWIIDPIDGTVNFAAGRAPFAMMVALLRNGVTIGSWIFDPLSDQLAVAVAERGAWIDGLRMRTIIHTSHSNGPLAPPANAFAPPGQQGVLERIRMALGSLLPTARCAGYEFPIVANGARHFALYWRTLVGDYVPGTLLLTEAGGSVSQLDGTDFDPCRPKPGLIPVQNCLIMRLVRSLLVP